MEVKGRLQFMPPVTTEIGTIGTISRVDRDNSPTVRTGIVQFYAASAAELIIRFVLRTAF